ncbi:hypothetical protein G7Y89_g2343 [Cudoniella acicularis]|uniref:Uncharacterized protein n=1 Tax=Cudoniella acicularis TaxID=354080 RepID=A0A8H4RUL4_9HELO|nr:hypothetical protein G7Y89_g2343 [Cudoniella acicularis]
MAQNNCTALIPYTPCHSSFPRQPRNSPPTTFCSLPREIRDTIYSLALISPTPITVWKGSTEYFFIDPLPEGPHPRPRACVWWRQLHHEFPAAHLRALNLNLLFCNKTLHREAALIFYCKNTFSFEGDHNWDPLVSWLKSIGVENRTSLTSLQVDADRQDQAWQDSRGERMRVGGSGYPREEIYPRHPYLHAPPTRRGGLFRHGWVDNINPVVEEVFSLLQGKRAPGQQPVTISMQLAKSYPYPGRGRNPHPMEQKPENGWYSMDLPNLIEKFLYLHTDGKSIEVLWKGCFVREPLLAEKQELFEKQGWKMTIWPVLEKDGAPGLWVMYVLRRERFLGPFELMAQDPSPYSHSACSRRRLNGTDGECHL